MPVLSESKPQVRVNRRVRVEQRVLVLALSFLALLEYFLTFSWF